MPELLPAIEVETAPGPAFSVVFLHGLGADGRDFVPAVPLLGLPDSPGVRFIFPHAPMRPVTCNNGAMTRAWYDIEFIPGGDRRLDEPGIRDSRQAVRQLMARENERGVPSKRIILAGFSQGGAIAYTAGLTHPEPVAGIIALSAYIPAPGLLAGEFSDANRHTPIFAAHGTEDRVVSLGLGLAARDLLLHRGCPVEWHTYPIPHTVNEDELAAVGRWLAARLAEGGERA